MANYELRSFASADDLARAAADAWLDEIEAANRAGKAHCVALSGGRIMQKFFAATVEQARQRQVSFGHAHFFWADERCVPPSDPESNFLLADNSLFKPLGNIGENQIHRLRGEDSLQLAVKNAETELCRIAPANENDQPVLDLVLLGMGEDGHVASLFPNAPQNNDVSVPFLAVKNSPKPPPCRISLGYAALENACKAWVFVSGAGKESALRESLSANGQTPLARVIWSRPGTKIFSDLAGF